ncbi:MATE family efflux transporter [Rhodobacteraceae bacterium]|nr:MATE family efflux transporter [Paracoccaceae bacterium]
MNSFDNSVAHSSVAANGTARFSEAQSLLRLATPIAAIALVSMGMSVTDAAMVARLFGTEAMAAVAVGSDLYSILYYFGAGILGGLAPFYTAAVVRADIDARIRLQRIGQVGVLLVAALLVPIIWSAPDWLRPMGIDPILLDQGRGYTQAMALTLLPMLGVVLYRTMLTAAERPRVFLCVTLAMLPLNAGFNYLLMMGAGPLPGYGVTGAGISSFLVAAASLVTLAIIGRVKTTTSEPIRFDWSELFTVLRVGLPIGITAVAEVGVYLGATIYAATLGAADAAAHVLVLRVAGVAYAIPMALLQAAMVRMARAETLADPALQHSVIRSSIWLGLASGILLFAGLAAAADPLATTFLGDGQVSATAGLAAGLLLMLGVIELFEGPCLAAAGLLRGRKDTRAPMLFTIAGNWVIGAPLGIYLCEVMQMGITGVWIGLLVGMVVTTILTLARLAQTIRAARWLMPQIYRTRRPA